MASSRCDSTTKCRGKSGRITCAATARTRRGPPSTSIRDQREWSPDRFACGATRPDHRSEPIDTAPWGRPQSRVKALEGRRRSQSMETKRMKTFVTGLDEILSGGLPTGHVRRRLHVLDGASIRKGLLPGPSQVWMDFMYRTMNTKKDIWGIDLLVIDSLEALEVLAQMQDRRTDLFGLLEWLRDFGATSLLVTEGATDELIVENDGTHIRRDEGFLADGIIELKMHPISDTDVQRRIRVIKMRGSHHKTGFYTLVFEDGRFQATRAMS